MNDIKCTKCNNLIPQESAFCPFCGEKVEIKKNEKTCTHCNNYIPLDSEFCPYCGEKIKTVNDASFKKSTQIQQPSYGNIIQTKTCYNFVNTSSEYKRTAAKHIKVLKDEEIILIGDTHKQPPSIVFWYLSLLYYIVCFFVFYFSHTIEKGPSSGGYRYYFLGFLEYKYRDYGDDKSEYFVGMVILIALICTLFALVPYWVYKVKSNNILHSEFVLTNQHVYYYSPNEEKPFIISIRSIKSIECKPCIWFNNAHLVKIVLNINVTHKIPGLSNAQKIIETINNISKNNNT